MSKHYRSDVDEYTCCPSHATSDKVFRPKSMRAVNSTKELNRLKAKLDASDDVFVLLTKANARIEERALKAERIIKDMFAVK